MSTEDPTQPRWSPDRRWYWNGSEWRPAPGASLADRQMPMAARLTLLAVGIALAAGVELVAWVWPETVRQMERDPAMSGHASVAIVAWFVVALALAAAGGANWIVWLGSRAWTPERRS